MWTRPDTGSALATGIAPTWSAAKGIFESIARLKSAYICPTRVEICAPVITHRYTTNYQGPLRKGTQIRGGDPFQMPRRPRKRLLSSLRRSGRATPAPVPTNHLHALQEMFNRRLQKGQCFRPVCLGWSEFLAAYWGPLRKSTHVEASINATIPSMLHSVFRPRDSRPGRPALRTKRGNKERSARICSLNSISSHKASTALVSSHRKFISGSSRSAKGHSSSPT